MTSDSGANNWFDNRIEQGLFFSWIVVVFTLLLLFLFQIRSGVQLKTNILELMPASEQDPVFETSRSAFEGTMGKTVLILIESNSGDGQTDANELKRASESVKQTLSSFNVFHTVKDIDQSSGRTFYDLFFSYRYQILAPSVRNMLNRNRPIEKLTRHVRRNLHRQSTTVSSELIEKDPLFLFTTLAEYWGSLSNTGKTDRANETSGEYKMLVGRLNRDPMATGTQKIVHRLIDQCKETLQRESSGTTFRWTGLVRIARVSRNRMQNDASFIGTISMVGVVLLVVLAFRSLRQLILLVLTVLIGLMTAFSVSTLVFNVHVITIAFGATLIGISVDYAFHYFCNYRFREENWTAWMGLRQIFPGITFGFITSVIAFASLAFTPLPALRQIAFFTSVGLLGAYLTVVCWFPFVFRWLGTREANELNADRSNDPFLYIADRLLTTWKAIGNHTTALAGLFGAGGLVLVLLAFGYGTMSFNDNIEDFAQIPDSLKENDRYIREITGIKNTGRYILVRAPSEQELLERQERVHNRLSTLKSNGAVGGSWGIGQFLPSKQRQNENLTLLKRTLLAHPDRLRAGLKKAGYKPPIIDRLFNTLRKKAENMDVLTPEEWLNHPASFGMRQLWFGSTGGEYSSLIILNNIQNEDRIRNTFNDLDFAQYRNRRRAFTNVMRRYRERSIALATMAYVLILVFLIIRYGPVSGVLMFLPASLGSAITLSILSLTGVSFNLMHMLGVLIILGMGIDYTIFLVEEGRHGYALRPPMLALLLSALTTVLSFGSLAFSQAAVINSIGIVVFPGILLILLLSPIVCLYMPHE